MEVEGAQEPVLDPAPAKVDAAAPTPSPVKGSNAAEGAAVAATAPAAAAAAAATAAAGTNNALQATQSPIGPVSKLLFHIQAPLRLQLLQLLQGMQSGLHLLKAVLAMPRRSTRHSLA